MKPTLCARWFALFVVVGAGARAAEFASHPPLRTVPAPKVEPLATGRRFFVDPKGDDAGTGAAGSPWRTVGRGLASLAAGDTLYLRGGVHHGHAVVRLQGRPDAPITIDSYPGEQAILDGGFPEFTGEPGKAWEPVGDPDLGEFRSAKTYPNLRTVTGWFGDSMIGLHTYHHAVDLRARNEFWEAADAADKAADVKPVWCGPGVWYDNGTGRIHCRLAATHLPSEPNYKGESDPRKLPLVIAPLNSVPLHLDGAKHVRIRNLVIRGAGYDTVRCDQTQDVTLDNVTLWCGSYGLRADGARGLKLLGCGFHGSVPPWTFRTETSLRSRPDRGLRDITRLGTHALLVPEAGRESSVFAFPRNDDWEIAHCDFTDAHDGVYLGGIDVRFHHNRIADLQDDGIYLSPMYPRYAAPARIEIHSNIIEHCLTALAFGGPETVTTDAIFISRNIVDLRAGLRSARPSSKDPVERSSGGHVMSDHGSPPWSKAAVYHNTFIVSAPARSSDLGLLGAPHVDRPRLMFNNILIHGARLAVLKVPEAGFGRSDGNLYWTPGTDAKAAAAFFAKYRASPALEKSRKVQPDGFEAHSLVADPKLDAGFAPQAGSPTIDAGVELPAGLTDPARAGDAGKPDIGALPVGGSLKAGRAAR